MAWVSPVTILTTVAIVIAPWDECDVMGTEVLTSLFNESIFIKEYQAQINLAKNLYLYLLAF